jgi:cytoskeleton protein RodZ
VADEKTEPSSKSSAQAAPPGAPEATLGQVLAQARKSRGLTPDQLVAEARVPAHYVRAIETDDYATVSDELYLLPFLRRYAICVGLDPEEVASRFVREVQRAENNPSARIAEPISMVTSTRERKPPRGRSVATTLLVIAIALLALAVYLRRESLIGGIQSLTGRAPASPAASPAPSAQGSNSSPVPQAQVSPIPFKTVIAPDSPASAPSPAAAPSAAEDYVN